MLLKRGTCDETCTGQTEVEFQEKGPTASQLAVPGRYGPIRYAATLGHARGAGEGLGRLTL